MKRFVLLCIVAMGATACAPVQPSRDKDSDAVPKAGSGDGGAATELPDCNLAGPFSFRPSSILERSRPTADATTLLSVSGRLHNGAALTFARDEPVLVADLSVSTTRLTLVPTKDITLKSSWALSFSYHFPANVPITAFGEIKLDESRKLLAVRTQEAQVLFVDEQGRFCNKALNAKSLPNVWAAGILSQQPSDAAIIRRIAEEGKTAAGFRVIFNGVSGGQLSFQEVWVNGSTVIASQQRNFDQFAKRIKVGPFAFDVLGVAGGKVTLRYEIPERAPMSAQELARLPLRVLR
jgi:hypothetical protein